MSVGVTIKIASNVYKKVKLKQPNICINTDCVMLLTLEACLAYFLKCFLKITDKFLTSICNSVGNALNDKGRCSSNWRLIPLQILPWGNFQRILRDFLNKKDTRVVHGDKNCLAIRPDCRIREKLCNRTIHSTRAILDAKARLGECNGSVIMCNYVYLFSISGTRLDSGEKPWSSSL